MSLMLLILLQSVRFAENKNIPSVFAMSQENGWVDPDILISVKQFVMYINKEHGLIPPHMFLNIFLNISFILVTEEFEELVRIW